MRDMSRKERCAMRALEHAIEHEPALRPALVSDYAIARAQVHSLRGRFEVLVQPAEPHHFHVGSVMPVISARRAMDVPDLPGGKSSDFEGCRA
jgi:hypothetical protein